MNNFGLNDDYDYRELELDSYDAQTSLAAPYSASDWPNFIFTRPLTNIRAMKVLEVQIPVSYYVINSDNNKFVLDMVGGPYIITMTPGNYSASSFSAMLQTALNAAVALPNFTVTYSNTTYKLQINYLAVLPLLPNTPFFLDFGTSRSDGNIAQFMGFNLGPSAISTNVG